MNGAIIEPTVSGQVLSDTKMETWVSAVAKRIDMPIAAVVFSVGAEAANVRRFTVQVQDRRGRPVVGGWLLLIWIATTATGTPGGAQTVTFVTGTLIHSLTANVTFLGTTTSAGSLSFDVDAGAGAQTRHVTAVVLGPTNESGANTWT